MSGNMRRIEVRLAGEEDWEGCDVHVCHALQITSNGDLVVLGVAESPMGQDPVSGQQVFGTKLQHGYGAGEWGQFRDTGEVQGMQPGELAN